MAVKNKVILILIVILVVSGIFNAWAIIEYRSKLKPKLLELEIKNLETERSLEKISSNIINYFRVLEKKCGQFTPQETSALNACVYNLIQEVILKPKLTQIFFQNPKLGQLGSIVFINVGERTLDADKFKLYWNNVFQDNDGCKVRGKIKPQFPCELNFYQYCREGDVLEVFYGDQSVAIITQFPK